LSRFDAGERSFPAAALDTMSTAAMISRIFVRAAFRCAAPSDVAELVALVESAYRGDSSRLGWTTEADLLGGQRTDHAEVTSLISDPSVALVLAMLGEELAGSVAVRIDPNDVAHIGMFAIRPTLQGSGLGTALLAEAERVARDRGAFTAEMTVIEQRLELLAWYARRGYHPTGETEPFPYGNPRFGLPRRNDLRFLVLEKHLAAKPEGTG
jgi:GNAT superfamily N-acetyltransferase